MRLKLLTLLPVAIFALCSLAAEVKFHAINDIYGVSIKETYSICKDNKGFIWSSAKTGILRVSDNDLRTYQLPCERTDIVFTRLACRDSLLIAYTTSSGQLFTYNELYDRFDLLIDLQQRLDNPYINIWNVIIDDEYILWIATSTGIYRYNGQEPEPVFGHSKEIQSVVPYKDKSLFITTHEELYLLDTETLKETLVYKYNHEFQASTLLYDPEKEILWIGSFAHGLFRYDIKQREITAVLAQKLPRHPILALEKNKDHTLLVGFDGQGVWELSADRKTILSVYKEDADAPFSLRGNGVYDIFCDDSKRVWVATYTGGLSYFDQEQASITQLTHQINNPNSLIHNYVNKILEDSKGNIWFATNQGLSRWERPTDTWHTYLPKEKGENQVIQAICEDRAGRIWVGTYSSGVYLLDGNTGKIIQHLSCEKGPADFSVQFIIDIFQDSQGDIWLGGTRNINCYLQNEKRFRFFGSQPIRSFAQLSPDKILLACTYGLVLLDKKSGKSDILIGNILIQDIWVQGDDIWAATSGEGLIQYNYKTKAITKYTTDSGLLSNYINSILYADNYLWLGTESGLCHFDIESKSVTPYTSILPLSATSFNLNSCLQLKDGSLIWGTDRGAVMFNPDSLYETELNGTIFFQDIVVSGNSIRKDEQFMNETPINKQSKLTLDYSRNNFALELLALGTSRNGVKFSWKLEGLDSDWSQPSFFNLASYPNLPNGDFELRIRMFDTSLSQVIDERSLLIHVTPPFWNTWWFRLIVILIITGFIVYLLRAYSNQLKQKYTKDKIRFFTSIAHDIRTSLTLVKAPIEELNKAAELSARSRFYLNLATEQSEKLLIVSNQLLDFQKVDTGKEKLYLTMTDLVSLVSKRILIFGTTAQKKNIRLLFSSNRPSYLTAIDELKMEKVIDNLLSNAIKYSHADSQVEIELSCQDKEWSLKVTDHGLGIPKEAKDKLFKEFYRGDNTANSKIVGSGIGLLLIKEYTMIHGGKVSLESKPNEGSSFKVTAPYKKVHEVSQSMKPDHVAPEQQNNQAEETDQERTTTLLIVEDNEELRNFLQASLSQYYLATTASDGLEAWQAIEKKAPDLILSDIMMPNMDGFELCKRLKSNFDTSHIPIILLTALSEKTTQLEGLGLGADDYITKPFDISILLQRIKTIHKNREIIKERTGNLISRSDKEEPIYNNKLNDQFVKKAFNVVHNNISNNNFGKDEFASSMHVSSSLLYQKLKSLTGQSPTDFIRTIRLTYAMELLNSRQYNVTEVSEMCGFSSANYFSTAFKKHFGQSPAERLS